MTDGQAWFADCLAYLKHNRDRVVSTAHERMLGLQTTCPEASYLAWIDCCAAGIGEWPARFFLDKAGVALNEGAGFQHPLSIPASHLAIPAQAGIPLA